MKKLTSPNTGTLPLRRFLDARIIGQDAAKAAIVEAYLRVQAGLNDPQRPLAIQFFAGPTGVGKTALVEAFSEFLFADKPMKINCGEFTHSHEIAKLIGSPPGYLGHRETPAYLSKANVGAREKQVLLIDEVEKAGESLYQLLLGILDRGEMRTGANELVPFHNVFIFFTSNLGAEEFTKKNSVPGFTTGMNAVTTKDKVMEAVRRKFSPEFYNRIDRIEVFEQLGKEDIASILELELQTLQKKLVLKLAGLEVEDDARELILREGVDTRYGARHLRRTVDKLLAVPIALQLGMKKLTSRDRVIVKRCQKECVQPLEFFKQDQGTLEASA